MIVDACTDYVAIETRGRRKGINGERGAARDCDQRADTIGYASEIIVQIFKFSAPIRSEHPFSAGPNRPTNSCAREGTGSGPKRSVDRVWNKPLQYIRARSFPTISKSSGCIGEKGWFGDKTDAAANRAEIVKRP